MPHQRAHAPVTAPALVFLLLSLSACALAGEVEVVHKWSFQKDAAGWTGEVGVKGLRAGEGGLTLETTGADAFLVGPPIDVPLDGCVVRVRLRGDRAGTTQIFWQTNASPAFDEGHVLNQPTRATPAGETLTLEFPIGKPTDAGTRLTRLRVDPYNDAPGVHAGIESIELLRLSAIIDVNFAACAHHVDLGERLGVRVTARVVDGRVAEVPLRITLPGQVEQDFRPAPATQPATQPFVETELRFEKPGVHRFQATVAKSAAGPRQVLESSVIVGKGDRLPLTTVLRSECVRLDLIPTPDGEKYAAARWQIADQTGAWRHCGFLLPLCEFAVEHADGSINRHHPAFTLREHNDRRARATADIDDVWHVEVVARLRNRAGVEAVEVESTITGPPGGRVRGFSGPVLRADRDAMTPGPNLLERFALFGGLEFLEPGWPSSSDRAVGEKFANRWAPDPFKITLPVMAVEAAGVTTAMMWQPMERWAASATMPTATFASPNFLDAQANHLMKLSVPTFPIWRQENECTARKPYVLSDRETLRLRCVLYGEAGLPVALTARRWYDLFDPPPAPPAPHSDRATWDLMARCFGETLYRPAEKAWRNYWYFPEKSAYNGQTAAELIAHALTTGQNTWIERTGLKGKGIIEAVGPIAAGLGNDTWAKASLASMRLDGMWPFVNSERMREQTRSFTHGRHSTLGEDGSTSLGTCVQPTLSILHYARLTGDEKYARAGLRALMAMRRFRVPRGAQVWEVHQEIPDIRAAALAVEAYHIGWQLTGDARWLDDANYWAWTGVPFVYSWRVPIEDTPGKLMATRDPDDARFTLIPFSEAFENPSRRVTPYGTLPVLGPTFYEISWFGVLVQWCGLEWAQKVILLDRDHPDPMLRLIADGVVASGLQQTLDKAPWVGLYPDSWDLRNNRAQPALISPSYPMLCLQAQGRIPPYARPWTRVLRDRDGRQQWHVTGWGVPALLSSLENPLVWSAVIEFPAGQAGELVIAGAMEPQRVMASAVLLERLAKPDVNLAQAGWWYDPGLRTVVIHYPQATLRTTLRLEW